WGVGGKDALQQFQAAQQRKLVPLSSARIAMIIRRDNPGLRSEANKLLRDVTPRLSAAEVAWLQGWFRRHAGLGTRYAQAMQDAGRAPEARAQALMLLAWDTSNKDAVNLLKKMPGVSAAEITMPAGATQSVFHVDLFVPLSGDYEAYGRSLRAGLEI